jgi:hypothetical protein
MEEKQDRGQKRGRVLDRLTQQRERRVAKDTAHRDMLVEGIITCCGRPNSAALGRRGKCTAVAREIESRRRQRGLSQRELARADRPLAQDGNDRGIKWGNGIRST